MKSLRFILLVCIGVFLSACSTCFTSPKVTFDNPCRANRSCGNSQVTYVRAYEQDPCGLDGLICQGRGILYKEYIRKARRNLAISSYYNLGYDSYAIDSY